jgi:DNA adenine methylase
MPKEYNRYYEPFIGGGALFFEVAPKHATISDYNHYLIYSYRQIRENIDELIKLLETHDLNNSKEYYLNLRMADRNGELEKMSEAEQAARLLYMLRVDFNGLYRVNSKNQFNVPYGKYKNPRIVDKPLLKNINKYLIKNDIEILQGDFEQAVREAKAGDFVYFDPPYAPLSPTSSFTSYTKNGFGIKEQERLRDLFVELTERGVKVMLSNSDVPLIHELYGNTPNVKIETVGVTRLIGSNVKSRGKINEVIIRNYE